MSSNRRSYAARKKRGGLTRTEHLQLAKKRGQLGTFRQDAEANRQLQKEFAASGAYTDADLNWWYKWKKRTRIFRKHKNCRKCKANNRN